MSDQPCAYCADVRNIWRDLIQWAVDRGLDLRSIIWPTRCPKCDRPLPTAAQLKEDPRP